MEYHFPTREFEQIIAGKLQTKVLPINKAITLCGLGYPDYVEFKYELAHRNPELSQGRRSFFFPPHMVTCTACILLEFEKGNTE